MKISAPSLPILVSLTLLGLCIPRPGSAENQSPSDATPVMTLEAATQHALSHRPQAAAAAAYVLAATREAELPALAFRPRVGAVAQVLGSTMNNSTASTLSDPLLDIPRVGATQILESPQLRPYPSTLLGATVRQTLYDFGRIAAETAALEALTQTARWSQKATKMDIRLAVADAFFAVLAARRVQDAANAAFARAKSRLLFSTAAVETGMRPSVDQARAAADEARLRAGVLRAQAGVRVARTMFAATVGLPGELDAVEGAADEAPLPSMQNVLAQDDAHNPRIAVARARLQAQQQRTRAIDVSLRPQLQATAGITTRAGGAPAANGPDLAWDGWVPWVPNWHVGLVLRWPLSDPSVAGQSRASRAQETVLAHQLEETQLQEKATTQAAYYEWELAQAAVVAGQEAVQAVRQSQQQTDARFREGLATALELADIESQLVQAEIELVMARFQAARARTRFLRVSDLDKDRGKKE